MLETGVSWVQSTYKAERAWSRNEHRQHEVRSCMCVPADDIRVLNMTALRYMGYGDTYVYVAKVSLRIRFSNLYWPPSSVMIYIKLLTSICPNCICWTTYGL